MKALQYWLVVLAAIFSVEILAVGDDGEIEEDVLSIFGDEDMVSIATGYSKPISKAPAVASVITADDIKKMAATDLDEVLESVPGLHVARDVMGYNPIYTFRGIYGDFNPQVLMLINGVPMTSLFQGNRHQVWAGMPVESISRIEVIRGPGSAVYGADAFAGVINIITQRAGEVPESSIGARVGSFDTREVWATTGGEFKGINYALTLDMEQTDGQDRIIEQDAQTFLDLLTGTQASLAPGPVNLSREAYDLRLNLAKEAWQFDFGYQHRQGSTGAGVAQALDPTSLISSDRISANVTYESTTWFENWNLKAIGSFLSMTQEVDSDLILFPAGSTAGLPFGPYPDGFIGNPEMFERHYRLNLTGLYTGINGHDIRIGTGYHLGDMYRIKEEKNFGVDPSNPQSFLFPGSPVVDVSDTPFAFMPEGDRHDKYAFLQDAWQFANDWELTAGLRYDTYSDFGSTVNPRIALVWSASHSLTTKLLYGEAFRAPAFAQTRAVNNPTLLGNPDIKPEELKSYELAFDYRPTANVQINMNLFLYEWDDIILFVAESDGSRRAQNEGKQKGHGLEFEGTWQVSENFDVFGNLSVVDTTDERTGTPGGNSPEKQLYLGTNWQLNSDWNLNLRANWVMDRQRTVVDLRHSVDDYMLLDSILRFAPEAQSWEAALIIRNLLNDDAREPSPPGIPITFIPNDLPLPGRTISGEIRFHFH